MTLEIIEKHAIPKTPPRCPLCDWPLICTDDDGVNLAGFARCKNCLVFTVLPYTEWYSFGDVLEDS